MESCSGRGRASGYSWLPEWRTGWMYRVQEMQRRQWMNHISRWMRIIVQSVFNFSNFFILSVIIINFIFHPNSSLRHLLRSIPSKNNPSLVYCWISDRTGGGKIILIQFSTRHKWINRFLIRGSREVLMRFRTISGWSFPGSSHARHCVWEGLWLNKDNFI